ncbi:hypothetical protein HOJ01_02835 [bacterium]|jgi:hypothetical protein|nr:hypothetical protein [bacterium]MBT6293719.1 hypothetical protein [bacterium]
MERNNKLTKLEGYMYKIPNTVLRQILNELARDRQLNPEQVDPNTIYEMLFDMNLEIKKSIDDELLGQLVNKAEEVGIHEARDLWFEEPNPRSLMGGIALDLRLTAKQIIAIVSTIDKS